MTGRDRAAARAFGLRAETLAALWLRLKGYRVLARQFRASGGEVDIIARRGGAIVFVEVKARGVLEDAQAAITPQKLRRMSAAAARWLVRNPAAVDSVLRVDAVFIAPGHVPLHIENIAPLDFG